MYKILLISHSFPPQYGMGAQRIGKLTEHLPDFGFLPLLVTGGNFKHRQGNNVFRPKIPDIHSIGRKLLAKPPKSSKSNGLPEYRADQENKLRGFWPPSEVRMPDKFLYWIAPAVCLGLKVVRKHRPKIIYSSSGPPASAIVASIIQKFSGLPWVAEFRDLWWGNHYDHRIQFIDRLDEFLESKVLKTATTLVTVSKPLANELYQRYRKPTFVIYNGFDEADYPFYVKTTKSFTITYTGMIYPGKRDPSTLFQAIKILSNQNLISPSTFKVRFYGPNLSDIIGPLTDIYGVSKFSEVNDPIPRKDCLVRQCESELLLILGWNNPQDIGTVTGKIFEYLGAGRPILGLGYPQGAMAEILKETGMGVIFNEPQDIADYLRQRISAWSHQRVRDREVTRPASVLQFTHRTAAARLAEILNLALRG
jgi:glycosyltransferase involved in cell wall biosynthesis